jgi:hypothetical protein
VRLYFAHTAGQVAGDRKKICTVESAVRIVEYMSLCDVQNPARGRKLGASKRGKFFIGLGPSPIGRRLPGGEADDEGLDTA